ncbi:MAG: M20 family metallopeptidase [Thermomicrobiales bacterium]
MNDQEKAAFERVETMTDTVVGHFKDVIAVDTSVPPGLNYDRFVDIVEPSSRRSGSRPSASSSPRNTSTRSLFRLRAPGQPRRDPDVTEEQRREGDDLRPYGCRANRRRLDARAVRGNRRGRQDLRPGHGGYEERDCLPCRRPSRVMDAEGIEPSYDLIVCICTDEEIGGYPGIWHLAKEGYVQGHMLCLEGGQDPRISLASAGAVDVTVTTIGRSGHSGMNFVAVNAIDGIIPVLNELYALKLQVEARESEVPGPAHPDAPSDKMTPMFNLAVINAGRKSNIVPSSCSLIINRRYIPDESFDDVVSEIRDAIDRGMEKSVAEDVKVEVFHVYPAMKTAGLKGEHTRKMVEAYKLVHGYSDDDFVASGGSGSTDMANVHQELGWTDIPFSGPGRMDSRAHGADEFVRVDDVLAHMKVLIHYLAF